MIFPWPVTVTVTGRKAPFVVAPPRTLAEYPPGRAHSPALRRFSAAAAIAAAFLLALPSAAAPAARSRASASRAAPARPAPSLPSLSRVLARTFRFYGGVDAILAVEGLRLQATIADGTTDPKARPRLERLLQVPDRYRSAVSLGGLERESLILDGSRTFRDGAEVTGLVRADQIKLEAARAFLPAALARGRETLVDRGEARRAGRPVRLVELALHERATLTAEIDPSSGKILRAVTRVAGRESTVSFRRLRSVEGVLFPFAEDLEARDGKRTVIVENVELVRSGAISIQLP